MPSMNAAEKLAAMTERPRRAVYVYPVPAELAKDGKADHTLGLVELTAEEELQASKRARNDGARLAYELAKASLHEVDGQQVSVADGSSDSAWASLSAPLRNLVLQAFADLHAPSDDATKHFLKGRQIKV